MYIYIIIFYRSVICTHTHTCTLNIYVYILIMLYLDVCVHVNVKRGSIVGTCICLQPERRGFEPRPRRHVGTLSKSFAHNCSVRFGVKTPTQCSCCSWKRLPTRYKKEPP